MKVAVLGNSHAAALKYGYDNFKERYLGVDIDFYAANHSELQRGEIKFDPDARCVFSSDESVSNKLARSSGGNSALKIDDYDVIVYCALGLEFQYKLVQNFYSNNFRDIICGSVLRATLATQIALDIRMVSDIPMYVLPCPLVSSDIHFAHGLGDLEKNRQEYDYFCKYIDRFFSKHGVFFLPQVASTIKNCIFTKNEYEMYKDSTDRIDHKHMNMEYGALMLSNVFSALKM